MLIWEAEVDANLISIAMNLHVDPFSKENWFFLKCWF